MSLLGEALDLLRKYGDVVGIDWEKGPSILDRTTPNLSVISEVSELSEFATSPILAAAQLTIYGMKATTGSGEPEDGKAFEKSADLYEEAGNLLIDAAPVPDRWNGTGSETYKNKNGTHRHFVLEVAAADNEMRQALNGLAAHVTQTRKELQDVIDFLTDYDTSTSWLNFVPGGAAIKAAGDAGVAATQLGVAQASIAKLVAESVSVARSMQTPLGRYGDAAKQDILDAAGEFGCGEPFGDERRTGQLPRRTDPEESFELPEPPPVVYPPATPYESPRPR